MINIAIALDNVLVLQSCVLLYSIGINNQNEDITVYVLYSRLNDEDMYMMQSSVNEFPGIKLNFCFIDKEIFGDLPDYEEWSIETFYRLALPDILPGDVERILYLDIDMIVNKSLTELYYLDFEGNLLAAGKDSKFEDELAISMDKCHERFDLFSKFKEDGYIYFCSGLILYNIKDMRNVYTVTKYLSDFAPLADILAMPDQDLLNLTHKGRVKYVDENLYGLFTWPAHERGMTYEQVKTTAVVLHYAGRAKPWTTNLVRYDIEKIWWEYAKNLPFYNELIEQVFFNSMSSTLTEETILKLNAENAQLRELLIKCQKVLQAKTEES